MNGHAHLYGRMSRIRAVVINGTRVNNTATAVVGKDSRIVIVNYGSNIVVYRSRIVKRRLAVSVAANVNSTATIVANYTACIIINDGSQVSKARYTTVIVQINCA